MRMRTGTMLAAALAFAVATSPAHGAGFGLFENGAAGMGLAGAFTAQADDGSAMFFNVGGMAFATERMFQVGGTYITFSEATFDGAEPTPGAGSQEEQVTLKEITPHVYYVQPLGPAWRFGLGIYTPFGLSTEWENPETFSGRYQSTFAALRAVDLNPSLAWQATPKLGIGFGLVARFSDVEFERYLPAFNPIAGRVVNAGRVNLESDFGTGYGFNVGFLHKYNNSFSWGLSYRSKVKLDYEGDGRFTQISTGLPPLDAAIAAQIPFGRDLDVETEIEFPDMASLGVAMALTPSTTLEIDVNWAGWSSFDELPITFVGLAPLSSTIPENWDDSMNYRAGLRWKRTADDEWRFGYVFDETPQPERHVSPLLPDNDRNGFTVGWGHRFTSTSLDLALLYLPFDERKVDESANNYFGTYNTTAWLLGATIGF